MVGTDKMPPRLNRTKWLILLSHPALSIVGSVWGLVLGVTWACITSGTAEYMREHAGFGGYLLVAALLGRPWFSLGVGVMLGLVTVAVAKHYMRRDFDKWVAFLRLDLRSRWRGHGLRPRSAWVYVPAVAIGAVLALACGLSWLACVYGILVPSFLGYPERKRIYRALKQTLGRPEEPDEV